MTNDEWLEGNRQIFKNWVVSSGADQPSNRPVEVQEGCVINASCIQWRIYNMQAWTPRELAVLKQALRKHLSPEYNRCILFGKSIEEHPRFYQFMEDAYPDCMDYCLEMDVQSLVKKVFK